MKMGRVRSVAGHVQYVHMYNVSSCRSKVLLCLFIYTNCFKHITYFN